MNDKYLLMKFFLIDFYSNFKENKD